MGQRRNSPVNQMSRWVRRQSMKVKTFLAVSTVIFALVALKLLIKNQDNFFVASEAVHFLGIVVLIYKLTTQKSCSGLSLKFQELTAIFLAVRLACSVSMEGDVHTVLDFVTLVSTLWVIYMMRFKLKSTYASDLDTMPLYYVVVPCGMLAFSFHPMTSHALINRIAWAFCVYVEAVSVLPQLRMVQKAKYIEPFTAHYVFALGVARFLGFAHWIIQVYDTRGMALLLMTGPYIWRPIVFLAEIIQTFILADFCYYYVKSLMKGQVLANLPV
ncbi:OLC1v1006717C1 [Oldenlandia corymbosa var. corymbosa]|uniref:OLC1v1006717C1 n=1 Tax=Oldenlandia corymbosa var. corymbosa TaxID=529605 RepID=A0AAV1DKA9_OLDCO|nr:OLC1v1006717C1 [Oldenlandia corymbosa var. corymbosa]